MLQLSVLNLPTDWRPIGGVSVSSGNTSNAAQSLIYILGASFAFSGDCTHVQIGVEGNDIRFDPSSAPTLTQGLWIVAGSFIQMPIEMAKSCQLISKTSGQAATLQVAQYTVPNRKAYGS